MAIILANGEAGNPSIQDEGEDYRKFKAALDVVNQELAKMTLGWEGASKFIEVSLIHAPSSRWQGC